jgi:murein DD-endopeptidase MepM/ murein hydrolase activator NlpD
MNRFAAAFFTMFFAAAAFQSAGIDVPDTVRQGETIRIDAAPNAASARMAGRTVPLFNEAGRAAGLMPVEVNQTPGIQDLEILDAGGRVLQKKSVTVQHVPFPVQNIIISASKKQVKPSPGEMETVAALRQSVTPDKLWVEPFARPVDDCQNSPFGVRRLHNGVATGNYHRGLDQRSRRGTPIRAITDGMVRIVRMFNIHGGLVGIDHGQGLTSFYLHMSRLAAKEGARVRRGDVIGYVGSTGFATGPHLHWQLTVNGVPVNPHQWVKGIEPCVERPPAKKPAGKKPTARKPRRQRKIDRNLRARHGIKTVSVSHQ